MTAFECDEPSDFMHLMLRLRDSEASRYTERDTPIFVGQHVRPREALARLDGLSSLVEDNREPLDRAAVVLEQHAPCAALRPYECGGHVVLVVLLDPEQL